MKVDHNHRSFLRQFGDFSLGEAKRTIRDGHEHPSLKIEDCYQLALLTFSYELISARCSWRVISGSKQSGLVWKIVVDLLLIPDMISRGHRIDTQVQYFLTEFPRQTKSTSGVFDIGNGKIDLVALLDLRKSLLQNSATATPNHITDK